MITFFQLQNTHTKEVVEVNTFKNCQILCAKANALVNKALFEVTPASLASINKFADGFGRKPIFDINNIQSIDDIRMADAHQGLVDGGDSDDGYTERLNRERNDVVENDVIEAEIVNEKRESVQEKVKKYLVKCRLSSKKHKKRKSIKNKR